ncbi:MAG: hypothetical protein K2X93_29320 [Candidatus Obscuribacterales bacterium]|nr:hypothetical protein [Candidatus Obscuribacterales bacterium]
MSKSARMAFIKKSQYLAWNHPGVGFQFNANFIPDCVKIGLLAFLCAFGHLNFPILLAFLTWVRLF